MKLGCEEFVNSYQSLTPQQAILLDVRNPDEIEQEGALPGSLHIPLGELSEHLGRIPADKKIFIYCRSGGRAERAEFFLNQNGFRKTAFAAHCGYQELKHHIKA